MNTLTLSPRRVGLLMRHDLASQKKSLVTGMLVIAGVTLGVFLITAASGGPREVLTNMFSNILLIGGFVTASMAFNELQEQKTGIHYMMLPGSALEKFLAKLLLTSIGWAVAVIVVFALGTILGVAISSIFFATNPGIVLPATRDTWVSIATYLVSHSIFLFGSIYFRKAAFIKTAAGVIGAAFALALIWVLVARFVFAPAFGAQMNAGVAGVTIEHISLTERGISFLATLESIGKVIYWAVMPIFFWVVGLLRLRETEV
jgi:hypothetical protein